MRDGAQYFQKATSEKKFQNVLFSENAVGQW